MAFAHADHYPVMTDNARMSDDKPVHLAPDLRTDDRHRFRVECQQASDISFSVSMILGRFMSFSTVVPHDDRQHSSSTLNRNLLFIFPFSDVFDKLRRHSAHDRIRGHVLRHDRTRPDDGIVSNGHPLQNGRVGTYPDIFPRTIGAGKVCLRVSGGNPWLSVANTTLCPIWQPFPMKTPPWS